jgi:hypothetical protein
MKNFDIDIKFTDGFDKIIQNKTIYNFLYDWSDLIKKQEIKAKKELRLKKINEINVKYK